MTDRGAAKRAAEPSLQVAATALPLAELYADRVLTPESLRTRRAVPARRITTVQNRLENRGESG
jgi:hypothetical protein